MVTTQSPVLRWQQCLALAPPRSTDDSDLTLLTFPCSSYLCPLCQLSLALLLGAFCGTFWLSIYLPVLPAGPTPNAFVLTDNCVLTF